MIDAVIFDLDGVLLDSEQVWDEVREQFVLERGGRYDAEIQRAMMGMSSPEWSRYLHDEAGVEDAPDEIVAEVVRRMLARYRDQLPLMPGSIEAVERVGARWPLGLASSSNRPLIDAALDLSGLSSFFRATVSSEEVPRGKPAPDVYLETARRVDATRRVRRDRGLACGHPLRQGGRECSVVAIPNAHYPPDEDALAEADVVLDSIGDLTAETIER